MNRKIYYWRPNTVPTYTMAHRTKRFFFIQFGLDSQIIRFAVEFNMYVCGRQLFAGPGGGHAGRHFHWRSIQIVPHGLEPANRSPQSAVYSIRRSQTTTGGLLYTDERKLSCNKRSSVCLNFVFRYIECPPEAQCFVVSSCCRWQFMLAHVFYRHSPV